MCFNTHGKLPNVFQHTWGFPCRNILTIEFPFANGKTFLFNIVQHCTTFNIVQHCVQHNNLFNTIYYCVICIVYCCSMSLQCSQCKAKDATHNCKTCLSFYCLYWLPNGIPHSLQPIAATTCRSAHNNNK